MSGGWGAVGPYLDLYLVTDPALCGRRGVAETVRRAVAGGVTAVQVRAPDATARELCAVTVAVRDAVAGTGVPVLVDDRADVALAVGADGVHVGQSDLDPASARRVLGPGAVVGLSVSTAAQVRDALALPPGTVDYLGIGPVHATPTKPEAAEPLGYAATAELARQAGAAGLPAVAIGGVREATVAAVRGTGVAGVAVVSAICAAADPSAAARRLRGGR